MDAERQALSDVPGVAASLLTGDPGSLARPYETVACKTDLRPGGMFRTVMRSPEGKEFGGVPGCYLEAVKPKRLTWTARATSLSPSTGTRLAAASTRRWASSRDGALRWTNWWS